MHILYSLLCIIINWLLYRFIPFYQAHQIIQSGLFYSFLSISTILGFLLWPISHFIINADILHSMRRKKWKSSPFIQTICALFYTHASVYMYYHAPNWQIWILNSLMIYILTLTAFTDWNYFLISRFATLYHIPWILLCAWFEMLPISFFESLGASLLIGMLFFSIQQGYRILRKTEGLGTGDIDLIMFIGAYSGYVGICCTLLTGCLLALLYALLYMLYKNKQPLIPFGTFLASAHIMYLLFPETCLYSIALVF